MRWWFAQLVSAYGEGRLVAPTDPNNPRSADTLGWPSRINGDKRDIIDFLLRNRIHLCPGAVLILWALPPWYGITPSWNAAPSVLLAGFGIYQLNRVFDIVEDEINDPQAFARTSAAKTAIRNLAITAIFASLFLSIVFMGPTATAMLSIMLLAGILYSVPFLKRERGELRRLKQVVSLKNVIPSVVWPVTTMLYPAMSSSGVRLLQLLLACTAVSCGVFTIEVAWDVRDSHGDQAAGINTLATILGFDRALRIPLVASCIQALVIILLIDLDGLSTVWLLLAILVALLPVIAYLWKDSLASSRDRSHLLVLINILALIPLGLAGRLAA